MMKDYRVPVSIAVPAALGLMGVIWLLHRRSGSGGGKKKGKSVPKFEKQQPEWSDIERIEQRTELVEKEDITVAQRKIPETQARDRGGSDSTNHELSILLNEKQNEIGVSEQSRSELKKTLSSADEQMTSVISENVEQQGGGDCLAALQISHIEQLVMTAMGDGIQEAQKKLTASTSGPKLVTSNVDSVAVQESTLQSSTDALGLDQAACPYISMNSEILFGAQKQITCSNQPETSDPLQHQPVVGDQLSLSEVLHHAVTPDQLALSVKYLDQSEALMGSLSLNIHPSSEIFPAVVSQYPLDKQTPTSEVLRVISPDQIAKQTSASEVVPDALKLDQSIEKSQTVEAPGLFHCQDHLEDQSPTLKVVEHVLVPDQLAKQLTAQVNNSTEAQPEKPTLDELSTPESVLEGHNPILGAQVEQSHTSEGLPDLLSQEQSAEQSPAFETLPDVLSNAEESSISEAPQDDSHERNIDLIDTPDVPVDPLQEHKEAEQTFAAEVVYSSMAKRTDLMEAAYVECESLVHNASTEDKENCVVNDDSFDKTLVAGEISVLSTLEQRTELKGDSELVCAASDDVTESVENESNDSCDRTMLPEPQGQISSTELGLIKKTDFSADGDDITEGLCENENSQNLIKTQLFKATCSDLTLPAQPSEINVLVASALNNNVAASEELSKGLAQAKEALDSYALNSLTSQAPVENKLDDHSAEDVFVSDGSYFADSQNPQNPQDSSKTELSKKSWVLQTSCSSIDSLGPEDIESIWGISGSLETNLNARLSFGNSDCSVKELDVVLDRNSSCDVNRNLDMLSEEPSILFESGACEESILKGVEVCIAGLTHSPSKNTQNELQGKSNSPTCDNTSEGSNDSGRGGSEHDVPNQLVDSQVHFDFNVPSELCGRLIGKHGKNINQMKSNSGALISLTNNPYTPDYQICQIVGSQSEVDMALSLIRHKFPLEEYPHLTMLPIGSPPPVVLQPEHQVLIPDVMQLSLPEGVSVDVFVSAIVDACHVFVQQPTHRSFMSLDKLNYFLNLVYGQDPTVPCVPSPVESGIICVCENEGFWYRAMIMTSEDENGEAQVKFVDYGGYAMMPVSLLKQIRADFMTLPFQAVECFMANVTPNQGEQFFSEDATLALSEMTQGKLLQCQVVARVESGIPYIHLYQISPENNSAVMINRALVNSQLVRWIEIL